MIGHGEKVTHYVVVKRDVTAVEKDSQVKQMHKQLKKLRVEKEIENKTKFPNHGTTTIKVV